MKAYTDKSGFSVIKYPIISKNSGNKYEVSIYPFGDDDDRYSEGCIVSLYKKGKIFSKKLKESHFNNKDGKIMVSYYTKNDMDTDYTYDLIGMTSLVVCLYEKTIKTTISNKNKFDHDYKEFEDWNGEV
jgi:hypothetical protein